MAYCKFSDVRNLVPLIDVSVMDDTQLQVYMSRADNLINSKLRDTYIIPFNPVPPLIADISAEYSAYLALRTIYSQNSPNEHTMVQALKESAEMLLRELSEGELSLDAPSYSGFESSSEYTEKIFTLEDITPRIRGN